MKVKSAYRHALRKLTSQATQIRKLMKTDKSKGYFSVFREGGSQKYTDFLSSFDEQAQLPEEIRAMFKESCEKKVSRTEIMMKLQAIYLFRQKEGLEAAVPVD